MGAAWIVSEQKRRKDNCAIQSSQYFTLKKHLGRFLLLHVFSSSQGNAFRRRTDPIRH